MGHLHIPARNLVISCAMLTRVHIRPRLFMIRERTKEYILEITYKDNSHDQFLSWYMTKQEAETYKKRIEECCGCGQCDVKPT